MANRMLTANPFASLIESITIERHADWIGGREELQIGCSIH